MTCLPFSQVKNISSMPIIPLYHAVSEQPSVYVKHVGIWRSIEQFKADIAFLVKHYEPVSIEDIFTGKSTKKIPFHLTFDDGLKECIDWVLPILEKEGIPATFFVNSAFVDNQALFYRFQASLIIEQGITNQETFISIQNWLRERQFSKSWEKHLLAINYQNRESLEELAHLLGLDFNQQLKELPCYMTLNDLKSLQNKGFSIGAHSVDHPRYDTLCLEDQLQQTIDSLRFVQSKLKPTIRTFAFPFTDFRISQSFFKQLANSDCCDLSFGCAGLKKERINTHLQRIPFDEEEYTVKQKLTREYLYYLMKMPIRKNTFVRYE